jgi:hypothetical protein
MQHDHCHELENALHTALQWLCIQWPAFPACGSLGTHGDQGTQRLGMSWLQGGSWQPPGFRVQHRRM